MWTVWKESRRFKVLNGVRLFYNWIPRVEPGFPQQLPSLNERLAELAKNERISRLTVNIGLPAPNPPSRKEMKSMNKLLGSRKNDKAIERASRKLTLEVDLNEVRKQWHKSIGPEHTKNVAEHYGIYKDLFNYAYFFPYVYLDIAFPQPNKLEAPVYRGNVVKPLEAATEPVVKFEAEDNSLWTLILTNPDGHLTEENKEYVHWFVGNIPGNNISKGELIWDYLQPFPSRGTGFHRFVFILYKQERQIDYSVLKGKLPRLELKDRTFETIEFYRARQNELTPAGLAFFQSDWDMSVIDTFHKKLNMDEPVFEYDHEPRYIKKEEWFPKKKPFNLYLDNYRDPRDIAKEHLLRKTEDLDPFEKPKPKYPYPNVHLLDENLPSWYRTYIKRYRLGLGRMADQIEDEYE